MRRSTGFIFGAVMVAATAVLSVGAFNAWIDPFMQYRTPSVQPRFVTGFARHINAGMARNLDYDAVIVGSSYAMNFRNSDFDREFGGRTASFAMPGMFVSEGTRMVSYAFAQKRLKRVFFGLDFFAFVDSDNKYKTPDFLYDSSWTNDGPYLLSLATLKRSIYIALDKGPRNFNTNPDSPWSWAPNGALLDPTRALADFAARRKDPPAAPYAQRAKAMQREAIDKIEAMVAPHPDTQFEFFLPPYSALTWMLDAERRDLDALLDFRLFLAGLLGRYPNARLHDFQARRDLICNLDHYADAGHYGPEINRTLVTLMRRGVDIATPAIVRDNNAVIREVVAGRCGGGIAAP